MPNAEATLRSSGRRQKISGLKTTDQKEAGFFGSFDVVGLEQIEA